MTENPNVKTRAWPGIGAPEHGILSAVNKYGYLTSGQVCRLLYSEASLPYVQTRLKRLGDGGYLLRLFLPRPEQRGSAPLVYTLSRRGQSYLAEAEGRSAPKRHNASEEREHGYLFLSHSLLIADFLIGLELLERRAPRFHVAELRNERELRRAPSYVEITLEGREVRVAVIPDAWVDLHLDARRQMPLWVELDRGTIEGRNFRRKVLGIQALAAGSEYGRRFGTDALTVLFVTTAGERRLGDILRWTETVLDEVGGDPELFLCTDADPAGVELFTEPVWRRPFGREKVRLFDGIWDYSTHYLEGG